MLMYMGLDTWDSTVAGQSARATIVLDLPEGEFMLGLLADIEQAKGSLSVKTNQFASNDIALP
jgi:hypothetical protein